MAASILQASYALGLLRLRLRRGDLTHFAFGLPPLRLSFGLLGGLVRRGSGPEPVTARRTVYASNRVPTVRFDLSGLVIGFYPAIRTFRASGELQSLQIGRFDIFALFGEIEGVQPLIVNFLGQLHTEHPLGNEHGTRPFRQGIALLETFGGIYPSVMFLIAPFVEAAVVELDIALRGVDLDVSIAFVAGTGGIAFQQDLRPE